MHFILFSAVFFLLLSLSIDITLFYDQEKCTIPKKGLAYNCQELKLLH